MRVTSPLWLSRVAPALLVVGVIGGCTRSSGGPETAVPTRDPARAAVTDTPPRGFSMEEAATISSVTLDSSLSRPVAGCDVPLTGLLHRAPGGGWAVPWDAIRNHLATLTIDADSGEKDHVLVPAVISRRTRIAVTASIAPIRGTETMSSAESLRALRCGKVIARVTSAGHHLPMKYAEGVNYLVVSLNMQDIHPKWVFVVLNEKYDYRRSLPRFKYTPHYESSASPVMTAEAAAIRSQFRQRALSAAALSCKQRGWKACFIDGDVSDLEMGMNGGAYHGLGTAGWPAPRLLMSQPWVPCPLYGCCCGGDACHEDGS